MSTVRTTCTRDCPDACGLLVEVEGGRATGLRGAPDHPITRGFHCYKQRFFLERVYGPRRIASPLLKNGAGFKETTWPEAIELLGAKIETALERHGPLSLFHYQGGGSLAGLKALNRRFFNLLGGGTYASGSLCGGAGIAGQELDFGARIAHDPADLLNSKMIIVWGRNPVATNVHLVPILQKAKATGAVVVLIDPIHTETARYADYHLAPAPGTDIFLALALGAALIEMRLVDLDFLTNHTNGYAEYQRLVNRYTIDWLSRRCDVQATRIEEVAALYGTKKPAAILLGWGAQRYAWGGETFRFIDALAALTGNIGVPGGGASFGMHDSRHFDRSLSGGMLAASRREVAKAALGLDLDLLPDPPLEVGVVTCANPAVQSLDAPSAQTALTKIGFLTVIDYEMTETAKMADLVLPSTTFLEEEDVAGSFFHNYLGAVRPAIVPVGHSKHDLEIFQLLSDRLGVKGMEDSPAGWIDKLLEPVRSEGITRESLFHEGWIKVDGTDVPFEGGRFHTESGRFEFATETPEVWKEDAAYPLTLLSTHPREWLHSELTGDQGGQERIVRISPAAAAKAGVEDAGDIVVSSAVGSFLAKLSVDEGVRDDVAACRQGFPLPDGANAATAEIVSNIGKNACYYQTRVRIEKMSAE
ncbi:MAG: molybdopterin-containing oxidoreductase family protein [Candidatus Aquicultorales bacterium]